MKHTLKHLFLVALIFLHSFQTSVAQIKVIDLIPGFYSDETNQDAEPHLAVNPVNPSQIAASAITPNSNLIPLPGNIPTFAPIYVSTNGGDDWNYQFIIPDNDALAGKADITMRFGGNSGQLYLSTLNVRKTPYVVYQMHILRTDDFNSNNRPVELLQPARDYVDQPFLRAASVVGGAAPNADKIFVGNNNNFASGSSTENLSTVDFFDGASRITNKKIDSPIDRSDILDECAVRTAIHASGVVYAVFYKIITHPESPGVDRVDLIMVRDDQWCNNGPYFENLKETGRTSTGHTVVKNILLPYHNVYLGSNRLVGSHLSIAVDPNNAAIVYVAWADYDSHNVYTLHVRKSTDSGNNWSPNDLITVENAINPALAVNTNSKIAFLYQKMDSVVNSAGEKDARWETHLRRFAQGDLSWSDDILSTFLESSAPFLPAGVQKVYLGDYLDLMAVGKDFYGVFSASNFPDLHNFPSGVVFQREADTVSHKLFADESKTHETTPSIDPFFFHVTELDSSEDFYVRDFTESPTHFDEGLEPSTDPDFCITSDIWNRRSNNPGPYHSDGPENLGPQPSSRGDNFLFARVRRKKPAPAGSADKTVSLNYYYAEYGTGNNFMPTGPNRSSTLSFSASEIAKTTPGIRWSLPATSSHHICVAVEISTDKDPFIGTTLDHHAPGWNTGTDLLIINDNNRAQRNTKLYMAPDPPSGAPVTRSTTMSMTATATLYALIHNPTLATTDMQLKPVINPVAKVRPSVAVIGSREKFSFNKANAFVLRNMKPGESRFLRISYPVPPEKNGTSFSLTFDQVKNGGVVNAFTILNKYATMDETIEECLRYNASVFSRINALYQIDTSLLVKKIWNENFEKKFSVKDYQHYLKENLPLMKSVIRQLVFMGKTDPFGLLATVNVLEQQMKTNNAIKTANAHLSLLNTIDSYLTFLELQKGNAADILQTIYLQRDILQNMESKNVQDVDDPVVKHLIGLSNDFISDFEKRKLSIADYPAQVKAMLTDLRNLATRSGKNNDQLLNYLKNMEQANDPAAMQGEHIKFLLLLKDLLHQ